MNTLNKVNISRISIICFLLALPGLFSACTSGFDEINTSLNPPANINESSGDSLFTEGIYLNDTISPAELAVLQENINSIGTIFRKYTYDGVYNDYQRTTNLTHDIYAGYFANLNPSFFYLSPTYTYNASWSDKRWQHFYQDRTVEYAQLARTFWFINHNFKTGKGTYVNAFHVTRIYFAFLVSMMTDTYGDMPLTDKHLQGITDAESPKYRTQKEIYQIIFALLDDAVNNIDPYQSDAYTPGDDDRCYGGDYSKWVRFANTLRLRLALRISNADPEWARKEGEAALLHPAGLMIDDADNMKTTPKYAPVEAGGENSGGDENIYALCSYTWSDAGLNKDLEVAYKNLSNVLDPRCEICWYRPLLENSTLDIPIEADMDFTGSQTGDEDIQKPSYNHSRLRSYAANGKTLRDDAWFGLSRESVWLSYAESRFLLSEAALRGWSGAPGSVFDYFIDGIKASLTYYKIPAVKQDAYINGLFILTNEANPFLATDKEAMLEQIITQKWLAIFPNGNEGWAEFRRTDYPTFVTLPLINSSYDVEPGKYIKRITYPGEESLINENFPFLPDGLRQDDRLWWDVADTNDAAGNRIQPSNFRTFSLSVLKRLK